MAIRQRKRGRLIMPLPPGWHYVNSRIKSQGVRSLTGEIVSRTEAENTGARYMGYRNEHDYRANRQEADRYLGSVLSSKQGKADLARARAHARSQGRRFNGRDYRKTLLGLRNAPRDVNGDPIDRGPDSPISQFHDQLGSEQTSGWEQFISGTDTP